MKRIGDGDETPTPYSVEAEAEPREIARQAEEVQSHQRTPTVPYYPRALPRQARVNTGRATTIFDHHRPRPITSSPPSGRGLMSPRSTPRIYLITPAGLTG